MSVSRLRVSGMLGTQGNSHWVEHLVTSVCSFISQQMDVGVTGFEVPFPVPMQHGFQHPKAALGSGPQVLQYCKLGGTRSLCLDIKTCIHQAYNHVQRIEQECSPTSPFSFSLLKVTKKREFPKFKSNGAQNWTTLSSTTRERSVHPKRTEKRPPCQRRLWK